MKKCYHMTNKLNEIIKTGGLKILVGENSKFVNDTKIENLGISYSLGLEGIIATNAMFHARYQYELLENQTEKCITLDDMFAQDIERKEDDALGDNIYLTFSETYEMKKENKERDIADPKTKRAIDIGDIKGVILKNNENGEIKYDRKSILMYAIANTDINKILEKLQNTDRSFMSMEGFAKTNFSFKDYVLRYYKEMKKEPEMIEFMSKNFELEEVDIKILQNLISDKKISLDSIKSVINEITSGNINEVIGELKKSNHDKGKEIE